MRADKTIVHLELSDHGDSPTQLLMDMVEKVIFKIKCKIRINLLRWKNKFDSYYIMSPYK